MKYSQNYSWMFVQDAEVILDYLHNQPWSTLCCETVLTMNGMYQLYDIHKACRRGYWLADKNLLSILEVDQWLIDYLKPSSMGGADIDDENIKTMLKSHIKYLNSYIARTY